MTIENGSILRIGLPKGRMAVRVEALLGEAGITLTATERGYRPTVSLEHAEVKILKPQNIVEMLALGSRDVGFAGEDWVKELGVDIHQVLDTGLDPVQVVAAVPPDFDPQTDRPIVVATEYVEMTRSWAAARSLNADVIRSYGATEVFPPEDADMIVDNTATGATLRANGLEIFDKLMDSSTGLYASCRAMDEPSKRDRITDLAMLVNSVLNARQRVMLEVNATPDTLESIVTLLPCMREATVSPLYGDGGFAVRAAVPRSSLPALIPRVKAAGGEDLVVTALTQIIP